MQALRNHGDQLACQRRLAGARQLPLPARPQQGQRVVVHLEALAGAKDVQAVLALQSGLAQPAAEKAASYSRHVQDIVSGAVADLSKAFESTSAQSQKSVTAFLESSLKSAPAGSEAAVAVIKSALTAGNTAVESAQKAAKQAVKLVESNISTAASAGQKDD
jgi:phasin family protein